MSTSRFFSAVSVALVNPATGEAEQHHVTVYSQQSRFISRRLTQDAKDYGLPRNVQSGDHYMAEYFTTDEGGNTIPHLSGHLVTVLPGDYSKITYFIEEDGSMEKALNFFNGLVD